MRGELLQLDMQVDGPSIFALGNRLGDDLFIKHVCSSVSSPPCSIFSPPSLDSPSLPHIDSKVLGEMVATLLELHDSSDSTRGSGGRVERVAGSFECAM